jgi:streptogramin lyase
LTALEERIEADLVLGRHAELVPELEGLIREHPLREHLRAQFMLALYRSGRQSEALDTYQQARRMLSAELGLEPGRALHELQAAILRQDVQLDPPARLAGPPRRARRKRGFLIAIGAALLLAAAVALVGMTLTGGATARPPEVLPNSLVRIDPSTLKPTDVVPIGDQPDLVVLAGGFVWVTHWVLRDIPSGALHNAGDRTLTRIDPATGDVRTVGGGLAPCGLAADPSGDVWVANCFVSGSGGRANIVRVDATTLRFEKTITVPGVGGFYRGLAYGGGSLWVSEIFGPSYDRRKHHSITQVDPQTGEQQSIRLVRGANPLAWSEGYGDLWMSNFSVGSVSRLHAVTQVVDETIDGVATNPASVVVDGDTVWVADWSAPAVVRLRAVGASSPHTILLPAKKDIGVWNVAARGGAVWATNPQERALWRIDAKTNHLTRVAMRYLPTGVAADDDDVWVTVSGPSERFCCLEPS